MKKIVEVSANGCAGCFLEKSNDCIEELRIKGIDCACASKNIIYKEVESNDTPELKAGMIVEYDGSLKLCLENGRGEIGFFNPDLYGAEYNTKLVSKIYVKTGDRHYKAVFESFRDDDVTLIWSKPNSKIEEIEQTILKLQQEVKELKGENK